MKIIYQALQLATVSCILGYPYQFAYKCSKPVDRFTIRSVDECADFIEHNQQEISDACKEAVRKGAFYEFSFAVPYGESCELFGNGFSIKKPAEADGLTMTTDKYVYSEGSGGKYQCDENKETLEGDSHELFRIIDYKPGQHCGNHVVLKGVGGPTDEDYQKRLVIVRGAYDGQLGWEAKGLKL